MLGLRVGALNFLDWGLLKPIVSHYLLHVGVKLIELLKSKRMMLHLDSHVARLLVIIVNNVRVFSLLRSLSAAVDCVLIIA